MFTSIVVGTDGSPGAAEAVSRAAELAKLCGARLHVVTAYKPITELVLNPEALSVDIGSMIDPKGDATEIATKGAESVTGSGVDVLAHAVAGSPADALVDVAESQNADLIVVGNRGMHGKRRVLGSVPNSVSHHARCTVMIVSTTQAGIPT